MNSMGRDGWLRRALAAGRAGTGAARPGNGAPKRPCPRRVRRRWTAAIAVCAAAAAVVLPAAVANAQPSGLTYLSQFGTQGTGPGQFESPAAVAVNTVTGDVYVTDIVNDVVEVFSASGGYESEFGGPGVGNGQFNTPLGIAVDPTSGDVYVLDNGMAGFGGEGGRIQKFSASGTFMLSWAFSSFEANQIAVDSATGDVYATDDSSNDQVVEFDPNGSQLATFGSFGDGDGQFVEPTTIAVDPSSGDTYVVDTTGACRVQKFDSAGNFLFQFGSCGTGDGQFLAGGVGNNTFEIDGPAGMTVDPATGDLYAVDGGNDRVEVFDSAGNYLSEFGTSGTGNGQFSNPFGAALNPGTGELYVVDNNNDRVEILSTGQTSVAVSSSTDPSVFGQSVTFTATVSAAVGLPAPAGTVQFTVDNQDLGGPVTLNSGSATSDSTAELAVGDHAVSATYIPADGSAPISGTLAADQSVQQGATTTSLMSSPNPSLPGETVTYTATVAPTAPAAGTPTGAVSFSDGASVIGACTAQALTGSTATCIVSYPAGGTHQVTANYAGDSNFAGSTSNLVNEVVGTGSPAPLVVAIKPAFGPGAGGTLVGIAGENLCQATAVNFGAAPAASFTVAQLSAPAGITCTVSAVSPPGTGVVDVTVTSPGGTSATGPQDQFAYVPEVTAIKPAFGPGAGGIAVTIKGHNLCQVTGVNFGSVPAARFSVGGSGSGGFTVTKPGPATPCTVTAVSPPGTGLVDVTVTSPGGTSATGPQDQFSYAPEVTAIRPTSGRGAGGTVVGITGDNLCQITGVNFGSLPAARFSVGGSGSGGFVVTKPGPGTPCTVTAVSPPGTGLVDVTVSSPGGTSATGPQDQFSYAPEVTAIKPTFGPAAGGTAVTITGDNLCQVTGVDFGSVPATRFGVRGSGSGGFTVTKPGPGTPCTVTAVSPPGTGLVDVTVSSPGGTSATGPQDQFSYAPAVAGIKPASGPAAGGTAVTITGDNLCQVTGVDFGSVSATKFGVRGSGSGSFTVTKPGPATPCTVTAVAPAGTGVVDVTVTSPGGSSATGPQDQFSYQ